MILRDFFSAVTGTWLTGDSTRDTALGFVRAQCGTRMFVDVLAEGVTINGPAMRFQLVDRTADAHLLEGPRNGLLHGRIQVDIHWQVSDMREQIGEALVSALDGYIGFMVNTWVEPILWDNEIDDYEPDRLEYVKKLDFRLFHDSY